jgi:hypothetical protein
LSESRFERKEAMKSFHIKERLANHSAISATISAARKYAASALIASAVFLSQFGFVGAAGAQTDGAAGGGGGEGAAVAYAVAETLVEQARGAALEQTWEHASIPGGTLALVAYIALWVLIFAMIVLTLRRQRAVNDEVAELGRRMDSVFEDIEKMA